jgi:hypothetical protein
MIVRQLHFEFRQPAPARAQPFGPLPPQEIATVRAERKQWAYLMVMASRGTAALFLASLDRLQFGVLVGGFLASVNERVSLDCFRRVYEYFLALNVL